MNIGPPTGVDRDSVGPEAEIKCHYVESAPEPPDVAQHRLHDRKSDKTDVCKNNGAFCDFSQPLVPLVFHGKMRIQCEKDVRTEGDENRFPAGPQPLVRILHGGNCVEQQKRLREADDNRGQLFGKVFIDVMHSSCMPPERKQKNHGTDGSNRGEKRLSHFRSSRRLSEHHSDA